MITYTCDICGEECASVQHVDRYQVSLDLCVRHLEAWIHHAEVKLCQPEARIPALQHALSRAYMDALFNLQTQAMMPAEKTWMGPKSPEGLRPVTVDEAVGAFRQLVSDFKTDQARLDDVAEAANAQQGALDLAGEAKPGQEP